MEEQHNLNNKSSNNMDVSKDYRNYIEKAIKESLSCSENEDLFEEFVESALKKAEKIINIEDDEFKKEFYLNKAVSTAIVEVLKAKNRFNKFEEEKIPEDIPRGDEPLILSYPDFEIPAEGYISSQNIFSRDDLEKIKTMICEIDRENNDKKYYKLFCLKYIQEQSIEDIINALQLSQGEISKRLSELSYKIFMKENEVSQTAL